MSLGTEAKENQKLQLDDSLIGQKMEEKDLKICSYNQSKLNDIQPWLTFFNKKCIDEEKTEEWKLKNLHRYLDDDVLEFYLENCTNLKRWNEVEETLLTIFSRSKEEALSKFFQLKLQYGGDIVEYYKQKTSLGRKAGLNEDIIIHNLTENVPVETRNLLIINNPQDLTKWILTAKKIWRNYDENEKQKFIAPRFQIHNSPEESLQKIPSENIENATPRNYLGQERVRFEYEPVQGQSSCDLQQPSSFRNDSGSFQNQRLHQERIHRRQNQNFQNRNTANWRNHDCRSNRDS